MLRCMGAKVRRFSAETVIFRCGEPAEAMGLVLAGGVRIEQMDLWGNRAILDRLDPGQIFAETYACVPEEPMMVDVVAAEDTTVLLMNADRLLQTCSNTCPHHNRVVKNLLRSLARKNLRLSHRIQHTTPKTIRGRLLAYLAFETARHGSQCFSIPFDRQQLADYLCVDRSALSRELGIMRREGLLEFRRNQFQLKKELDRE